jgi:hypothetical protein
MKNVDWLEDFSFLDWFLFVFLELIHFLLKLIFLKQLEALS